MFHKLWRAILAVPILFAVSVAAQTVSYHVQTPTVAADGSNAPTSFKQSLNGGTFVSLGMPSKDGTGNYAVTSTVPAAGTYNVTGKWSNTAGDSTVSNQLTVVAQTAPPTGAQSAIDHFELWVNGALADASFIPGDVITDTQRQCAQIRIKGNAYLERTGQPGSIKKVLDNNTAGAAFEKEPPFAWEDDGANCAASLKVIGTHSLTVTPYDGDGQTGLVGPLKTVSFTVQGATTPPPVPLGAPGQPTACQKSALVSTPPASGPVAGYRWYANGVQFANTTGPSALFAWTGSPPASAVVTVKAVDAAGTLGPVSPSLTVGFCP